MLQNCVQILGVQVIDYHKVNPLVKLSLKSGSTTVTSTPEVSHMSSLFYSGFFSSKEFTILTPWISFANFYTLHKENHACTYSFVPDFFPQHYLLENHLCFYM